MDPGLDARARDTERALAALTAVLDEVPARMGAIREMAAERRHRRRTASMSVKLHALLVRLRHDAWMRTQDAFEAADDASDSGDTGRARDLRRRAARVRTSLDAFRDTLLGVLDQVRLDETEAAARRQRVLGWTLAALAGFTAFPLLLGQMDDTRLRAELSGLPGPFGAIGRALGVLHPWLAFVGAVGALTLVVVLAGTLIRAGMPARERGADPVVVVGRALIPLRRLAASPGAASDQEACRILDEVLATLRATEARGASDPEEALDAFVIRAELGARRPVPFPLPRASAKMREALAPVPGLWSDEQG